MTLQYQARMAKMKPVSTEETTKKSFFRQFRVLALPVGLMVLFGFLGHRPGQLFRGCSSYLFNSYVIFNNLIIFINALNGLVEHQHTINHIFFIFFNITAILIVFLLNYKFYKKNNLYSVFVEVTNTCTNTSWKEHIFTAVLFFGVILPSFIYNLYEWIITMNNISSGDERFYYEWFTIIIIKQTLVKMLVFIETWVKTYIWMCFLSTSYVLSVINLMISAEYDKIVSDLHCKLDKEKYVSRETFSHVIERFYELTSLVDKVNDMFSDIVAVNLAFSLASLCTVSYGILLDDGTVQGWGLGIKMSSAILVLILPPAILLNEKVCLKKWIFPLN